MKRSSPWQRLGLLVCAVLLVVVFAPSLALLQEPPIDPVASAAAELAPDSVRTGSPVVDDVLNLHLLGFQVWRLLLAALALGIGFASRSRLGDRLLRPLVTLAERTDTAFDERLIQAFREPLGWFLNLLGCYIAVLVLGLSQGVQAGALLVIHVVGIVLIAWALYAGVEAVVGALNDYADATESRIDDALVPLVRSLLRVVVVVVATMMIIEEFGYNATSLVAGLGIGGLAFALAAQQTLANLFGSLMIFTDRPFGPGDWIKTKHGEGIVEDVGLRSTRVRTFSKSLLSVPNADIAGAPIENFSEMTMRRIKTDLALSYATTPAQMKFILAELRALIEREEKMFHDAYYVNFVGFEASSLTVMILVFTTTTDFGEFMEIRQRFFLNIMNLVERAGTSLAFPSQSLYIETPIGSYEQHSLGSKPEHEVPEEVERFMMARWMEREQHIDVDDGAPSEFGDSDGLTSGAQDKDG
ncbi:MAG: mechanosensitive ion channel family protein [Myxococcota bacterium]